MTTHTTTITARQSLTALLAGSPPTGLTPTACGPWQETVQAMIDAWTTDGTMGVIARFNVLSRSHPGLAQLVAGDGPLVIPPEPIVAAPALPAGVLLPVDLAMQASPWLDAYVAHSRHWSPRSFDDFHEAIAIWLLSTVAARRIVAHLGKPHYTPLSIALAGRSTMHAKTTAAEIGMEVLRAAGLDWFLADDSATPQKFIRDRVQRRPDGYDSMPSDEAHAARQRLAFAGQCGWWYDEFGMLLHAMARNGSTMGDFSGLLRRFDDCATSYTYGTLGRPVDKILYPYLALLASLTPADLRPLMRRGAVGWSNGFWPRWAFVTPPDDTYRVDRFPPGERHPPAGVVGQLRAWHERLGVPEVAIHESTVAVGPLPVQVCPLDDDLVEAFYAYNDGLLTTISQASSEELDSWYGRLPTKALRVALLLSSVEGCPRVTLAHFARGQQIAERWRASLHRLYDQVNAQQEASQEVAAEDAVLKHLERLGTPSVRDLRTRIPWLSNGEITQHLERLIKSEVIEALPGRAIRYRLTQRTEDEELKN